MINIKMQIQFFEWAQFKRTESAGISKRSHHIVKRHDNYTKKEIVSKSNSLV